MKQARLGRSPKTPHGLSPWTSILVRVFAEVLSGAQLPLEHGVAFIMRGTPDARSSYRPPDQPTAPTSDRRYEHAPVLARDTAQLHSRRRTLRNVPAALTRYCHGGRRAPLPDRTT